MEGSAPNKEGGRKTAGGMRGDREALPNKKLNLLLLCPPFFPHSGGNPADIPFPAAILG
jgi:hypothetical protein